jgi:fructose-1-phosphate kinase PfkB-like protein
MGSESVLLSLGSRGAMLGCSEGIYEVVAPEVDAVCPIGAGDALAAAYAWARDRGESMQEASRWGVACGTATAVLPGVNLASLAGTEEMLPRVEIRKIQ